MELGHDMLTHIAYAELLGDEYEPLVYRKDND